MGKKIAYLHTVASLVDLFNRLSKEILPPETEVMHIADEMLLHTVLAAGKPTPFAYRRVGQHVRAAEEAGADLIQLTCSSISECAEPARSMVAIPVLTVDEPMVDRALELGQAIGVAATAPTTLRPTAELVRKRAAQLGKQVNVEVALCPGAYAALFAGDREKHDIIVRRTLRELVSRNEVVLLAQASMARVLESIPPEELYVPVLTSPRLAVERAATLLQVTT